MNKSFLCTLMVVLALLQTARAGDAFRVSIAKGDQEPKLDKDQIEEFTKAGVASPDLLPIVVCPSGKDAKIKADPSNTFQVVIENAQGNEIKIAMAVYGGWYDCLSFKLVDDSGNTYSIAKMGLAWSANVLKTRTWAPNGKQIFPVSFFENFWGGQWIPAWYAQKGSGDHAPVEWPAPKHPVIAHLTATFRYYSGGKSVEVSSKPVNVILMAK